MRFEKLNDDKIRITLSHEDLVKKDIDFHSFMSNSVESQKLFFEMLNEAEKEIGFVTKDYLIRIEALALAGGEFILTITRSLPDKSKKKIHIKRKKQNMNAILAIYLFNSFEDYCSFAKFYKLNFKTTNFAKKVLLYEYSGQFYLVLDSINTSFIDLKKLFSCITEFAICVSNSEVFERKISENGKLIMKNNAVSIALKYFAS